MPLPSEQELLSLLTRLVGPAPRANFPMVQPGAGLGGGRASGGGGGRSSGGRSSSGSSAALKPGEKKQFQQLSPTQQNAVRDYLKNGGDPSQVAKWGIDPASVPTQPVDPVKQAEQLIGGQGREKKAKLGRDLLDATGSGVAAIEYGEAAGLSPEDFEAPEEADPTQMPITQRTEWFTRKFGKLPAAAQEKMYDYYFPEISGEKAADPREAEIKRLEQNKPIIVEANRILKTRGYEAAKSYATENGLPEWQPEIIPAEEGQRQTVTVTGLERAEEALREQFVADFTKRNKAAFDAETKRLLESGTKLGELQAEKRPALWNQMVENALAGFSPEQDAIDAHIAQTQQVLAELNKPPRQKLQEQFQEYEQATEQAKQNNMDYETKADADQVRSLRKTFQGLMNGTSEWARNHNPAQNFRQAQQVFEQLQAIQPTRKVQTAQEQLQSLLVPLGPDMGGAMALKGPDGGFTPVMPAGRSAEYDWQMHLNEMREKAADREERHLDRKLQAENQKHQDWMDREAARNALYIDTERLKSDREKAEDANEAKLLTEQYKAEQAAKQADAAATDAARRKSRKPGSRFDGPAFGTPEEEAAETRNAIIEQYDEGSFARKAMTRIAEATDLYKTDEEIPPELREMLEVDLEYIAAFDEGRPVRVKSAEQARKYLPPGTEIITPDGAHLKVR